MSTVVQPCARCGSRWAVQGKPMHWCPRCRGVLLSPAPVDAPAPRRNYRWVARQPGRARDGRGAAPRSVAAARPTPQYTQIPRWGLRDVPPQPVPVRRRRLAALTDRVDGLLRATIVLFLVAAAAEFGRYLLLMLNRSRLIEPVVVYLSDWSVWIFAAAALVLALLSAVALVGWLIEARRGAYAREGQRDPRGRWTLLCGCVIPVLNLLWPGVFLTELARRTGDPRLLTAVRIWWSAWVLNGVMVTAALFWHLAGTLQAQANGVILTVYTELVAAAVAVLSVWVIRQCEGRDLRGRIRVPKRWIATGGPAAPLIEPVHPVVVVAPEPAAEAAPATPDRAPEPEVVQDVPTEAESVAASEHEEVMAK
ncbi:DUF4328 domain-containing protein [Nocardia albiluteola]|nr:DUF4328 domain-containing protein [Nocardia albiluteola]